MSASGPAPESTPNFKVHPRERLLRHDMLMIVRPSPNDRVEQPNQLFLTGGFVRINDSTNFLQECVRILFRRSNEQFPVKFTEILSEEVEPLFYMRDAGLLWRELQAPVV